MTLVNPGPASCPSEQPSGRGLLATIGPPGEGGDLSIWTDQSASRCTLWLRGRLCSDTVAVLDGHVDRLGCRWCDEVIVDLGSLAGMDEVGARLLVGLGHYVAGRGGSFRLQAVAPALEGMLAAATVELQG